LKDRKASFKAAPGTSLFVHWMFGMVYVYYFAAFISLLREVLRPGVLWIFRNVNDPDFSPIQEMIHVPIVRHIRRLVASAMIFGFAVFLMLWLPIRILQVAWPNFLPYALSGDAEVNDLSLQLLLLQVSFCCILLIILNNFNIPFPDRFARLFRADPNTNLAKGATTHLVHSGGLVAGNSKLPAPSTRTRARKSRSWRRGWGECRWREWKPGGRG